MAQLIRVVDKFFMESKIILTNFIGAFIILLTWFATALLSGWIIGKDGNYNKIVLIVNLIILLALCIGATIRSSIEITQSLKLQKDETKWAPAREIVVRNIAKTYSTSFHAATQLMDFNYTKPNLQLGDKVKGKSIYLKIALQDFQRLQKNVQLNNAALNSNLMPIVSTFLESSENLLKKLKYYILIHNNDFSDRDFVSEPPFFQLETIENLVNKLKENYDDIFNDRHVVFDYLKTSSEIIEIWEKATKHTNRIFFQPSTYRYRNDRIPFLYDRKNLKALSGKSLPDGAQTQVFSLN